MDKEGPYFFGKEPKLVDFVMAPWAVRLWVFDKYKDGGLGLPAEGQGGEHEAAWTRWRKWLNAIENRASIRNTTSKEDKYYSIYQK